MGFGGRGGPWGMHGRGPGGGWGDGGGRGGHRGRRRVLDSGELRLVLLKLISDQPRHGYDLMRAIEELTGGSYAPSPGVVYPTLTMLLDMGFIEETAGDGSRKQFAVTDQGRSEVAEKAQEIEAVLQRLRSLAEDQHRAGTAPVGRAVGNLMAALGERARRKDADEETFHAIAAILDEAAQKIERLK